MNRRGRVAGLLAAACLLVCVAVAAAERLEDRSGRYRVRGECAYRDDDGEYHACTAWNTLVLIRADAPGRYRYELDTSTFATTQGGCHLAGLLRTERIDGHDALVAVPDADNRCPLRFVDNGRALELKMDPAETAETECRAFCGSNSSLYSDPFPRASRRRLPRIESAGSARLSR